MQTHFPNPESKPEIRSVQTGFWSSNSKRPPLDLIASLGRSRYCFYHSPTEIWNVLWMKGNLPLRKTKKEIQTLMYTRIKLSLLWWWQNSHSTPLQLGARWWVQHGNTRARREAAELPPLSGYATCANFPFPLLPYRHLCGVNAFANTGAALRRRHGATKPASSSSHLAVEASPFLRRDWRSRRSPSQRLAAAGGRWGRLREGQ